jgi:hypothetical protein
VNTIPGSAETKRRKAREVIRPATESICLAFQTLSKQQFCRVEKNSARHRFRAIDGQIGTLSEDAVQDENVGLVYTAQVRLEKFTLDVEGKTVPLSPGMAVTVKAKTGKRGLIEFLLSPLLRIKQVKCEGAMTNSKNKCLAPISPLNKSYDPSIIERSEKLLRGLM